MEKDEDKEEKINKKVIEFSVLIDPIYEIIIIKLFFYYNIS